MAEDYSRNILKVIVAQLCKSVGFEKIQSRPLAVMVDLLDEYLRQLGQISHSYSEILGRTDINLDDLGLAFQQMNIDLNKLAEYIENAGSIPCAVQVPKYPIPREDHLNSIDPESREAINRPEHIPEHLPSMYPHINLPLEEEVKDNKLNINQSGNSSAGSFIESQSEVRRHQAPELIKRSADFVLEDLDANKRSKLNDEIDQLRGIQSVIMTPSGDLSPISFGKLPESQSPTEVSLDYFEEPEISIIDERIEFFNTQDSVNLLPITGPPLKNTLNTEYHQLSPPGQYYHYSKDELTPPRTPEIPKTPEIKIFKVESLADQPEQEKWNENSKASAPMFPIFPVTSTGPGLIPYPINPVPSLFPQTEPNFNKNQQAYLSEESKIGHPQSWVEKDLFPDLQVDSSGKYSAMSLNSISEKLEKKSVDRRRKKGKSLEKSVECRDKRKNNVFLVDKSKPAFKSSTTKPVKENENDVSKLRVKLSSNFCFSPIAAPGTSVENKKKSKTDKVTKINSTKSLDSEYPAKKVTFKIPRKNYETVKPELFSPIVVKKTKSEVKKTSQAIKKEKQVSKKLSANTPIMYGANGERIWICPACGGQDDGTPMIGCDDCDYWYHWICIGMHVPPPREANWYCRSCLDKKSNPRSRRWE